MQEAGSGMKRRIKTILSRDPSTFENNCNDMMRYLDDKEYHVTYQTSHVCDGVIKYLAIFEYLPDTLSEYQHQMIREIKGYDPYER